ncbi:MAG TPA: hypothetical protein VOB72_17375, partial [Candidatus Dormibacteraeota bacterium]|nr:hypothetical protein [Candidatus Dormibacteraeota bacterium]
GADAAGRPVELELRPARPYVVLAGPDAGEALRCLVLSLAVRHSPRTLEMALIGPALAGLVHLPHVVPLPAGARPPEAPTLLVAVDGPPVAVGTGVHVVVAARDPLAAEASLGRDLTRRVAPGPAGAVGLETMAAAVVAVNRMLGSLQSSR